MKGPHVFGGYWRNPDATAEVIDAEGWFHTGDIGSIDADGFVTITDRKKDIIVTSAGKNVAPSLLEDALRSHWLVSQAAVFGDKRPYVAALLTLDAEALGQWARDHSKPLNLAGKLMVGDPALMAEVQHAVDAANATVSTAEAIKRWRVLPRDFSETDGELTPTLKLKRHIIAEEFAVEVESLYVSAGVTS
jgi:long-chain acyl-CoA synthetase